MQEKLHINFYEEDYESFQSELSKEKKPVFLYFTADYCFGCRQMESTTFIDSNIIQKINSEYFAYKVESAYARVLFDSFSVKAIPHIVVLDKVGKPVGSHSGWISPKRLDSLLTAGLEGAYK